MQAGIVGAGIMGQLLALGLCRAGWQITLFDQSDGNNNCSLAAAGLLAPISELYQADSIIFQLGQESITTYWPKILKELNAPIYFQQSGSIILNHPSDHAEWKHFTQRLSHQLADPRAYYQQLFQQELIQLEPDLAQFENAYYFPSEAQLDCQSLMRELNQYLHTQSVKFNMNTRVVSVQARSVISDERQYNFDRVFDCRGLGAKTHFKDLRAIRGELIWVHAPEVVLKRPIRLLHPRYSLYIAPRPGNIYLIGASEIESEDYTAISVRTTLELLTAAYYVHSGFGEARIIKTIAHCRPTLSNQLPRIIDANGLIAVNGLYRHGYLIAPALAEEILRGLNHAKHYPTIWEYQND